MVIKLNYKLIGFVALILFCITLFLCINHTLFHHDVVLSEGESIRLPIIMYHEVKTFKTGKDVITPYEFESDLKYLKENYYNTITMTQLIDYVYHDGKLPENPIILSFDDGYLNNSVYVLPLLEKYNMKIVLSLIGINTDDFTRVPDSNIDYSHVTWSQLNEMLNSGFVEVQNHSYNLHGTKGRIGCRQKLGESLEKYEQVLTEDIGKLQQELTAMTGKTPNTFAYPYGAWSKNTDDILKKLGFQATLSCKYGINQITKDPEKLFRLKRICRAHGQSVEKLLNKGMKTLK